MSTPDAGPPATEALEVRLGHRFVRPALLEEALTHASWANERGPRGVTYERLEFLGDAVLGLVVSHALVAALPLAAEGVLSRRRAEAVCEASLVQLAQRLELSRYVRVGTGQRVAGLPPSVLADVFEAVVAAVYLDAGLSACEAVLAPLLQPRLVARATGLDAKTALQERSHVLGLPPPRYVATAELGPMHARTFEVRLELPPLPAQRGIGRSKKAAEQAAAAAALALLASEPPPAA